MNSLEQAEDLKAFERRLTEYIHCLQPATGRWRMLLIVVSVCTATGAWNWLIDPETQKVSFFTSLWNHPFFTISCITLIGLFFAGIHKRVVAPSIIAARCRTVLAEYNMSCDDVSIFLVRKLQTCMKTEIFGFRKVDIFLTINCLCGINSGNILYVIDSKILLHFDIFGIEIHLIINEI
uniref:Nuclear envelope phosphatase-regulatory subunit 1 n=2 Tax=Platyrrhini TaxID=9479 RepID=A0A2K5DRF6_AOTNA